MKEKKLVKNTSVHMSNICMTVQEGEFLKMLVLILCLMDILVSLLHSSSHDPLPSPASTSLLVTTFPSFKVSSPENLALSLILCLHFYLFSSVSAPITVLSQGSFLLYGTTKIIWDSLHFKILNLKHV